MGTFRCIEPAGERSSSRERNTDFLFGSNATSVETVEEASSPLEEPVVVKPASARMLRTDADAVLPARKVRISASARMRKF